MDTERIIYLRNFFFMSLAFLTVKNVSTRADGVLSVKIVSASVPVEKEKQVFLSLALIVPYSLDAKIRKSNQGKKINEQKGVVEKFRSSLRDAATEVFWNETISINIKNLNTINFLEIECWATRSFFSDSFLGSIQIPISNSYIKQTPEIPFTLDSKGKKESAELRLKLKLEPASPGHNIISLSDEKLGKIPKFLFSSFWLPRVLKELNLPNCGIISIPTEITSFSALTLLNVAKNQIQEIPAHLELMTSLNWLDLSMNQIKVLPTFFIVMEKLTSVNVIDNPLIEIPACYTTPGSTLLRSNFCFVEPICIEECKKEEVELVEANTEKGNEEATLPPVVFLGEEQHDESEDDDDVYDESYDESEENEENAGCGTIESLARSLLDDSPSCGEEHDFTNTNAITDVPPSCRGSISVHRKVQK